MADLKSAVQANDKDTIQKALDAVEKNPKLFGQLAALGGGMLVADGGDDTTTIKVASQSGVTAVQNNLCGTGACIATIALATVLAELYAAEVGDGSIADGLEIIGNGEDPLSVAVANGVAEAVTLSYETFPDATEATFKVLAGIGEVAGVTVTYWDDKTGKVVSTNWNAIDPRLRSQLIGAGKILSIVIPVGTVGKIAQLKKVGVPDAASGNKIPNLSKVDNSVAVDLRKNIVSIEADDVNNALNLGSPPYLPGTDVMKFTTGADESFVRVFLGGVNNPNGYWIVREHDIAGLTPQQIQQKLALPKTPNMIVDVVVPDNTTLYRGHVNPNFDQDGLGMQYSFEVEPNEDWFINARSIK